MPRIKTLVYFDLEATGLKSTGRPRISEISLVAVHSKDVNDLHLKLKSNLRNKKMKDYPLHIESLLPRVLNKLTLCVYPMAIIMPEVSDITGLDNYNLFDQTTFNKTTGVLLNNFLDRLPSPICLVAHNGNAYDFPLLKAEMEKAGIQLRSDILCADSYIGIKDIFNKRKSILDVEDIPQSFSLINLHKHLLCNKPTRSHGAEADCITLLNTTAMLGMDWINWMERDCSLISECMKMWSWPNIHNGPGGAKVASSSFTFPNSIGGLLLLPKQVFLGNLPTLPYN